MRLCLLIATSMSSLAGYNLICWSDLTAGDWAAWLGAIGTLGTLIGTIWLATAAERRRASEESARAVIAAHALGLRIALAREMAREAKGELESDSIEGFRYAELADAIGNAALWTDEEVLPMTILPRNVAAELVAVRDVLRHCVELLHSGNPKGLLSPARSRVIEEAVIKYLGQVSASLDIAASECHNFLRRTMHIEY